MSQTSGILRLINIGFRRFARDPESRALSSRAILQAAIALHAEYTSPADAALVSAESLAGLAAVQRRQRRAG